MDRTVVIYDLDKQDRDSILDIKGRQKYLLVLSVCPQRKVGDTILHCVTFSYDKKQNDAEGFLIAIEKQIGEVKKVYCDLDKVKSQLEALGYHI